MLREVRSGRWTAASRQQERAALMADSVSVDLVRDEVVTTRLTITVDVPENADPTVVARSVGVRDVDGQVRSTRVRGRYRWTPLAEIAPGPHVFVVEPLTDTSAHLVSEAIEVSFTVVETTASIPDRMRAGSHTRVRFTDTGVERVRGAERADGPHTELFKATDRKSGEMRTLGFDEQGREIDAEERIAEHHRAIASKMGKVHPTLAAAVQSIKRGALLVDVWIEFDEGEPNASDRPLHSGDVEVAERRADEFRVALQERTTAVASALGDRYEVVTVSSVAPLVTVRVPGNAVRELAERPDVAGLFLLEEEGIDDLEDSIAIAESDHVHAAGETGTGIRVAVWENGPTSTANLTIAGRYTTSPTTSDHSENVHAIIRNKESNAPHGHAPGCSLYSANSKVRDALTWAVDEQGCTVVNQSFHRPTEPGSDSLSADDLYGDYLALHWPYPLIVHAAGNFWADDPDNIDPPSDEYVNHKGYNTISVGNHNDTADAMSATSVFRNPASPHGDRELPEISANGVGVIADGLSFSGTSQASPAVAGIAALLQGTDATLQHWPEGCRAILLSSATRNLRGSTWWQDNLADVDARDGTGAVDAAEARSVSQNRRWRNAAGTRRGWDVGLLSSADFENGMSTFEYRVRVPSSILGPRNVKVTLAWTSRVGRILGIYWSNLTVDLDLMVFDESGSLVGYSGSWDNSYEIAEFVGRPGREYTIRIRRWSGTDSTWYGIAWTVTGGFTITFPFESITAARAVRRV